MHNTALKDERFCSIECKSLFLATKRKEMRAAKQKEAYFTAGITPERPGKAPWHLFQFSMGYLGLIAGGEEARDRLVDDMVYDMMIASDRESVKELVAQRLDEYFDEMEGYGENIEKREKA